MTESKDTGGTELAGVELPDGATESDTERDGFMSYAGEVHAFALGFAVGLAVGTTGRYQMLALFVAAVLGIGKAHQLTGKALAEAKSEPWYALGGVVLGVGAGIAIAGPVAAVGL